MGFSVNESGSRQVGAETSEQLMEEAFRTWLNADCGDAEPPGLAVDNLGMVECDQQEYNQSFGNTNLVVFRDDVWPYRGQGNTLALTTVTYNLDDGSIFDADLEINATSGVELTTDDAGVVYDLQSILTHEAGHMLGLAHSATDGATLQIEYTPGEIELRTLHPDDVLAICDAYPPREVSSCDTTPRHGFASECFREPEEEGCAVAVGKRPARGGWLVVAAMALWCGRRRRVR
jgi:hypothetical protein